MKQTELKRSTPLRQSEPLQKRRPISPASSAQREKVYDRRCIACGVDPLVSRIDPAHLAARSHGGCDDELCVVALCRRCHREFDDGRLSVLEFLVGTWTEELQHALGHYDGDLIGLLQRLTGERWTPERVAA